MDGEGESEVEGEEMDRLDIVIVGHIQVSERQLDS